MFKYNPGEGRGAERGESGETGDMGEPLQCGTSSLPVLQVPGPVRAPMCALCKKREMQFGDHTRD